MEYDDDLYKIHVKVENFKPEELIVKTVDNTVQVEPALYKSLQKPAHPGSKSEQPIQLFGQSIWVTTVYLYPHTVGLLVREIPLVRPCK